MKATPSLEGIFKAARYIVDGPHGHITLSIGRANPHMKALMLAHGARTAAILTAFNPGGLPQPALRNHMAQTALEAQIRALGLTVFGGSNRAALDIDAADALAPPGPDMTEATAVTLDLPRDKACELARQYGQLAWTYVDADGVPELVWT